LLFACSWGLVFDQSSYIRYRQLSKPRIHLLFNEKCIEHRRKRNGPETESGRAFYSRYPAINTTSTIFQWRAARDPLTQSRDSSFLRFNNKLNLSKTFHIFFKIPHVPVFKIKACSRNQLRINQSECASFLSKLSFELVLPASMCGSLARLESRLAREIWWVESYCQTTNN
ncbi:unnamed protein product, partial [Ectocarpus fasciculatus]